jgi:hypothetical protein
VQAYTEDGVTVHVFVGTVEGTIRFEPEAWVETDGWDPFFYPDGRSHSLAKLQQFKYILNMRQVGGWGMDGQSARAWRFSFVWSAISLRTLCGQSGCCGDAIAR